MKSRILEFTSLGLFTVAITISAPFARAGDTVTFKCLGDNNFGTCQEANPTAPAVTFPGPTLDISWYGQTFAIDFTDSSWLPSDSYDWIASNSGFIIFNNSSEAPSVSAFGLNTDTPNGGLSETGTLTFAPGTIAAPEPGTLALLFLGLAGVGVMRKRKSS